MDGDDATKGTSSGNDDTVPAMDAPGGRSSVPTIPPAPDARYQLGKELGRGGMGRVVEAFDTHLQRTVALKEVLPSGGNIERRFQREVRITARLEHAGIVPLYDAGRLADGRPFYVMRRVSGRPLDDVITRAGDLEGRLALLPNVLSAIEAIAHAHGRGVLHRDLKPQNILVGELGETVVIDWGLAKVIGDRDEVHDSLEPKLPSAADSLQTQVGSVFGTPGFMPPEQARGDDLGPQGDVYALGATLYQLIAGKPPFKGTSVTEVISSTLRHRYEALTTACPGAPPELSTIIDKALAFESENRYANAGELAEDVRRFLTGQLVAAHRYTRRQRVARFARRHRAPLVVAALASVGIAALAWFSVHRIVRERDTAEAASIEARDARAKAEERAVQIRERADQLLLLHARTLLDTYPTQTIAVLKQIESGGVVREEARALARAAVMRGVAWGLPTLGDITVTLELTPDGKRLVQVTRPGDLQVIDLDTRRQVAKYKAQLGSHAMWLAGGKLLLVTNASAPPVLFDPATGRADALPVAGIKDASVTVDGMRVAFADDAHRLHILDVATRQITEVPGRTPKANVQIAADGSWIAIDERIDDKRDRVVITDPSGRVLVQRPGSVTVFAASPAGKLAVSTWDELVEIAPLAVPPTITPVPADPVDRRLVHHLQYRDDQLFMVSQRYVMSWKGKDVYRVREFADGALVTRQASNGALVVTSSDSKLHVLQNEITHVLAVPARPLGIVRVATAPGSSRVVATAKDALLVWDLAPILPRRVPHMSNTYFATETTLVAAAGMSLEWEWWDIAHAQHTKAPLAVAPGLVRDVNVSSEDARTLAIITRPDERNTAVIAYPGGKQIAIEGILFGLARLVDGGGVIYAAGKGRIVGKVHDEEARELVSLDSDVVALTATGKLAYAALSKTGELVRGRFDGGDFARTRVADLAERAFLVGEGAKSGGRVLVASGNRLLRWDAALDEVARFRGKIDWMFAADTGVIVSVVPDELLFVPTIGDRTPRRLVVGTRAVSSSTRVISINAGNQVEAVELPSLINWTLPKMFTPMPLLSISPSGRRIYQVMGRDAALWEIPEPASDFPAWLDELTNATEIDNHVHWPWQPG